MMKANTCILFLLCREEAEKYQSAHTGEDMSGVRRQFISFEIVRNRDCYSSPPPSALNPYPLFFSASQPTSFPLLVLLTYIFYSLFSIVNYHLLSTYT
jgi:hypothetical protein